MTRTHNLLITNQAHYQLCYEGAYNPTHTRKVIRIPFYTWQMGNAKVIITNGLGTLWMQGRDLHSHDSAYETDHPTIRCTLQYHGTPPWNRTTCTGL